MKRSIFAVLAAIAFLSLGACSFLSALGSASTTPTGTTTPAVAQDVAYELESAYGVALGSANIYGRLPDCSSTAPQPCRSLTIMLQVEKYRATARQAINDLRTVATSLSPTASQLDTAIAVAKAAMSAYQTAVPATK